MNNSFSCLSCLNKPETSRVLKEKFKKVNYDPVNYVGHIFEMWLMNFLIDEL